jgi:hypothetical protein
MKPVDFYSLPHYYDILHEPGTPGEVDGLFDIMRRFVGDVREPVWLEPASGTGRYLIEAARRGVHGIGFDIMPKMIEYANRRAASEGVDSKTDMFVADMRSFTRVGLRRRAHLAFNLINTIRHVGSDAAMIDHLGCVAESLTPGGVYAVGISLCAYGQEPETEDVWTGKRSGVHVNQVVNYIPAFGRNGNAARTERVISHLTITQGGEEEHIDSSYGLRSYDREQWRALIGKSAMEIIATTDEHGEDFPEPVVGYILYILRARQARSTTSRSR